MKRKRMKKMQFATAIWKEGKYYVAQCLNVDISSFGTTKNGALKNLKEALELYLEDASSAEITRIGNPSIRTHDHLVYV